MTRLRSAAIKQAQRFVREPVELPVAEAPVRIAGHPLLTVARRLHVRAQCTCCGAGRSIWRVNVERIGDGQRTTIVLCDQCLRAEHRAWRLRWRPVPYAR